MTSNSIHGHESEGAFFHHPDLPYFDYHESGNVTARLGTTAVLNCRVKSIGNKTSKLTPTPHNKYMNIISPSANSNAGIDTLKFLGMAELH
ncbi:hypothetical protein Pcinc_043733 [Petrolisthes cinctipes]|uniref:Uncharacterized protein n=1 Tax=Petrolisthes cinctipes TaxID=88211 RepID=A0AAE1BF21_PETCI|nr:hypothetical protein Pcinc_043733 [Petrolisthes cinctipes]